LQVHSKQKEKTEKLQHRTHAKKSAPCECAAEGNWVAPASREPRCLFIDLGANNGNSFQNFLANGYANISNCPSNGAFEAILVEANPVFNDNLYSLQTEFGGKVRSLPSAAAYMCEGYTSFFLDTVDVAQNFWGSSMSPDTRDVQRSGYKSVTVPLVNLMRLLSETALKEDYVMVKMDIEGAEHDILPCLAKSSAAGLIDVLFVEKHPVEWSLASAPVSALSDALFALRDLGVATPEYDSPTF
jgi:FkbM family methyltransferase